MAELVPVRIGGHIVAYRPAEKSAPKSTAKKAAKEKAPTTGSASTAEEATK